MNGTMDFLSVDAYNSIFATSPNNGINECAANVSDPLWPICVNTTVIGKDGWLIGASAMEFNYIIPAYL